MELKFALIYDNQRLEIDEPIGFDAFEPEIERNEMHGVSVEFSDMNLEFVDCDAIAVIRQKYDLSLDSEVDFVVEMRCGVGDAFEEIYRGRLDLGTCVFARKRYSSVKCKVGQAGVLTTFNNRINTDVCLDSDVSVGGIALSKYEYLNKDIVVPGKMVVSNAGTNNTGIAQEYMPMAFTFKSGYINIVYVPGMVNSEGDDLGGFNYSYPQAFSAEDWNERDLAPFFEFQNRGVDKPKSNIDLHLDFKLRIETTGLQLFSLISFSSVKLMLVDEFDNLLLEIQDSIAGQVTRGDNFLEYHFLSDKILENKSFNKLYLVVVFGVNIPSNLSESALRTLSLFSKPSVSENILLSNYSMLSPTLSKCNLLHETLSRVSESITDGVLSVWSDYYGRPDSFKGVQSPYPAASEFGSGALRALTNGYKLRNYVYTNGDLPKMYVSMKKLIQSLSAIDNIGCGFYWNMGKWWLRVENWKWFYQDIKLFDVENPSGVERVHNLDETFTRLKIGYKKYADLSESNVVDTFHSERNFSTYAKAADKDVNVLSDIVADAYAIEYTRRKSIEKDTKDWQYDEDLFVLCVMRVHELVERRGQTISEQTRYDVDNGMTNSGNSVISPETMLNVYVSPARNALRWADRFSQYAGAKGLSYVSGTRNTGAKGKALKRTSPSVRREGDIFITTTYIQSSDTVVQENADISKALPLLRSQLLRFEYPITLAQYNTVRLNPYGYIFVDGERCWIRSMKYNFSTGLTKFELIPEFI